MVSALPLLECRVGVTVSVETEDRQLLASRVESESPQGRDARLERMRFIQHLRLCTETDEERERERAG